MQAISRSIWLRRGDLSNSQSYARGYYWKVELSAIGNAAARETFLAGTPHMAAIWSDLFQSMVTPGLELRWLDNGPGVGRDARIAYSSLLGRYMARAYLTEREGIRALLPLDVAKRGLKETPYVIEKDPPGKGLEADWIGLDNEGLVIVEAKGSYHDGARAWSGPYGRPSILKTAIDQVERTAVFERRTGKRLPAKRWAIASRWGTEQNHRCPTLLAWNAEEERLPGTDYREFSGIFLRADVDGVLTGMGHRAVAAVPDGLASTVPFPEVQIRVGGEVLESGLAAAIGPFGVRPIRDGNDVAQLEGVRELNPNVVVASLSSSYMANALSSDDLASAHLHQILPAEEELDVNPTLQRLATRAGLTVAWLIAGEKVALLTS